MKTTERCRLCWLFFCASLCHTLLHCTTLKYWIWIDFLNTFCHFSESKTQNTSTMAFLWKLFAMVLVSSYFTDKVNGDDCPYPGWTKWRNNCYRFFGFEPKSWEDAQKYCCNTFEADLVSIWNEGENNFVNELWRISMLPGLGPSPEDPYLQDTLWIGLWHDPGTANGGKGTWYWRGIHDVEAEEQYWHTGEPSGDGDCAHMWKNDRDPEGDRWNDRPCTKKSPFICKHPLPNTKMGCHSNPVTSGSG